MEIMTETKPGYKQTKLGLIPEDWEVSKLLNSLDYVDYRGKTPKKADKGIFLVTAKNIKEGYIDYTSSQEFIDESDFDSVMSRGRVKIGDVLITTEAPLGNVAQVDRENVALAQRVIKYRPKDTLKVTANYLKWYFLSFPFQKELLLESTGSTVKGIKGSRLHKLPLIIPSLPEQKAIAACLGSWDKAIDTLSQLIAQREQRKKGLMQQLLTGKKRLPGFSGEWSEEKLGDYFKERKETGYTDLPLLSVGEIGVYPQSEGNKKDTSNEDKSKYKRICPGDIGYNTMRMWQGRNALSQLEGIISPAYTVLSPKKNASSKYFSYLFKLPEVVHKFFRNSQGLVSDTLNCKYKDFAIVKVTLPPTIDEQVAISKVLDKTDSEIVLLGRKLEQLKQQKKGLMQQLLTGKKRLI
jgi:type I restriction enzyme S subunit